MAIIGIMKGVADPDLLHVEELHPDGMISFSGSAVGGEYETIAVVEMRIVLGEHDLRCYMSAENAQDLQAALSEATSTAFRLTLEQAAEELEAVTARKAETDVAK